MKRRQYRNPPIEEAVCEFRFAPGPEWNLTVPGRFYEKVKGSYAGKPRQQNLVEAEFQINPQPENPAITVKQGFTKIQFPNTDDQRLVAVGPDTLSVHILRPYLGWEEFEIRIKEALQAYQDIAEPVGVRRIALRYIDRIVIPAVEAIALEEYFTAPPQTPEEFPKNISAFLTRIESVYDDLPIKLVLTFADTEAPAGQTAFILDLDMSQNWIEEPLPFAEAVAHITELKQRQSMAFEAFITDRTRDLFDGA